MKTSNELTKLAVSAQQNGIDRAAFLAQLEPAERAVAAQRFDQAKRLASLIVPNGKQVDEEARRIAVEQRVTGWMRRHSQYYRHFLNRPFAPMPVIPSLMKKHIALAEAYGEEVTKADIKAARGLALKKLREERDFLNARLGLPPEGNSTVDMHP